MKVSIDQRVLLRALERGAMAALSNEAQKDSTGFASLIKSVKITAGKNLIVESGTNLLATRWEIEATKDNGVIVEEEGSIVIPAKELNDWASNQSRTCIVLTLNKFASPEIIKNNSSYDYNAQSISIRKVGQVKIVAMEDDKEVNTWDLDCYDPEQKSTVDFEEKTDRVLQVSTDQMFDAFKNVSFASMSKHTEHLFDSVVLEKYKNNLYMMATDTHRSSIYHIDQVAEVNNEFFTETVIDGGKLSALGRKVMIPVVFLKEVVKFAESSECDIHYDSDKSRVYFVLGDWQVRVATVNEQSYKKFPSVAILVDMQYEDVGSVPKKSLVNRLTTAMLVNKAQAFFNFRGAQNDLKIHAISELGLSPNVSSASASVVEKDVKVVLGVKHVMDIAKIVKDEDMSFMVAPNQGSVKVVSAEDPKLQYFSMTIRKDLSVYSHLFDE